MKILITGGAGFIGSHLCDRFIAEGDSIVCVDNLITGSIDNIRHLFGHKHFKFIKHNVTEYMYMGHDTVDYVLHFASPASPKDYLNYPIQTLKVGSLGTLNSLGVAKAQDATFLLASTSEVYGDPLVNPQPESYWGNVNPIGTRGVYDEAKRFAEAMTMAYNRYHNINTRIVRIFNTYGPRMRADDGRAVPTFFMQALTGKDITVFGDGSQTRSFTYITDTVDGICETLFHKYTSPINIGNPVEHTILDLVKFIISTTQATGLSIKNKPLPEDDPKVRKPDITFAQEKLDWEPEVQLQEGLRDTYEYFKDLC